MDPIHWGDFVVAVPSAAAVIIVVAMFLRYMREERSSRDQRFQIQTEVLEKLRDAMGELAREIRQSIR